MQKIIIVGVGFIGGMHAQVYAHLKSARVVAAVDTARPAADSALARLGLRVPVYATLREALRATEADVVDVCLPTHLHGAAVRSALGAGKHIFCEKPFAATARDALALAAAAERAGVIMQIGHCIRFWPEYQAFYRYVRAGRGGRLLSLSLQRRAARPAYSAGDWLNDGAASGGAALDLHIHDTDFVQHLLGTPRTVTSVGTRDATGWSHIFTHYGFPDVAVTAEGGWNYPTGWGFHMAFQAVFERSAVEFDSNAAPTLVITDRRGGRRPLPFSAPRIGPSRSGSGNVSSLGGYFNELASFIGCLERNVAPRIATPRQAAESVRIVNAEIRSAQTRRAVRL